MSNAKENHEIEVTLLREHAEKTSSPYYDITPISETSDVFSFKIDTNFEQFDQEKFGKKIARVCFSALL